jgi:hypothetical protein
LIMVRHEAGDHGVPWATDQRRRKIMYDEITLGHDWVAGIMAVHPEDLEAVHQARAAHGESIICDTCEAVYPTGTRCPAVAGD